MKSIPIISLAFVLACGLAGAQDLALTNAGAGPVALTVGGNGANTTYSGVLSGTGSTLTKVGAGTLTLSGANTYTGGTTVSAGTLKATNLSGSATGTGPVLVSSGATLWHNTWINVETREQVAERSPREWPDELPAT